MGLCSSETQGPTINDNVAHGVRPVLGLLSRAIVFAQLSCEVPQYSIALGQDTPVQFNDGDVGCWIHLRDFAAFDFRIFLKAVPCIIISYAGIFP